MYPCQGWRYSSRPGSTSFIQSSLNGGAAGGTRPSGIRLEMNEASGEDAEGPPLGEGVWPAHGGAAYGPGQQLYEGPAPHAHTCAMEYRL